jgi:hypothetical protein
LTKEKGEAQRIDEMGFGKDGRDRSVPDTSAALAVAISKGAGVVFLCDLCVLCG